MIGLGELAIIVLISIIFLKPDDYKKILKNAIQIYQKISNYISDLKNQILDDPEIKEINDLKNEIFNIKGKKYIQGDDGNLHEVFDINSIRKEIEDIKKPKQDS
jgi:hypothetical protein